MDALESFELPELLWLVYNATISLLFLIRVRPSVVSMNLVHWVVALITSFSGFIFPAQGADTGSILSFTAEVLIAVSIVLAIATALILGRSYDFLPALRHVKTGYAYQIVRHPMYLSSIIIKVGYVMKNLSVYNLGILVLVAVLYDRRAKYEEDIMSQSDEYLGYLQQVKYRFMPGIH